MSPILAVKLQKSVGDPGKVPRRGGLDQRHDELFQLGPGVRLPVGDSLGTSVHRTAPFVAVPVPGVNILNGRMVG
jgi:hypothetical protein